MNQTNYYLSIVFAAALSFVFGTSANAQTKLPFEEAISSIDTVPSVDALLHAYPNAEAELRRVATTGNGWAQQRAISLLSLFPNQKNKSILISITKKEQGRMSALAAFTLTQSYRGDKVALAAAEAVALAYQDERIRLLVLQGIASMTLRGRFDVLKRFSNDKSEAVRRRIRTVLVRAKSSSSSTN